jgi:hypothetical protein
VIARRWPSVALVLAGLLLAGCAGVPSSSQPEVIATGGAAQPTPSLEITPPAGADPRTIVSDFLVANDTVDAHTEAQGFLTPAAVQLWSAKTVTVLDSTQVSNFVDGRVVVTGHKMGTVAADGIYTPVLQGSGNGGLSTQFAFTMKQVSGQWRIDTLQNGLVVDYADFLRLYQQRAVYFFDLDESRLVPDPRYTTITDPALLASWLVSQMAAGPRPELQTAVTTEFPAQTDPNRLAVLLGAVTRVSVPGAAQLPAKTRNNLAAALAVTLRSAVVGPIAISDAGHDVQIPAAGGTTFTASNFTDAIGPANPSPSVYYLDTNGRIIDADGEPMPGRANGQFALTSVAVTQNTAGDLLIAGTAASGGQTRLYVGTQNAGLRVTKVRGTLTRPTWAPGRGEVWVSNGSTVFRVGSNGAAVSVPLTASNGSVPGRVVALRFSPEGTRIAMVIAADDGTAQIWIGAVVRPPGNGEVSVDQLEPISPQGIAIADVAWNGPLKLFAVGHSVGAGEPGVDEVQVDGSAWTARGNGNLPGAADSITITENQVAWVSTGQTVWEQRAGSWVSPGGGTTAGTNPVYLE